MRFVTFGVASPELKIATTNLAGWTQKVIFGVFVVHEMSRVT